MPGPSRLTSVKVGLRPRAAFGHSCQQENVERKRLFYGDHLHSRRSKQFTAVVLIKNMMVKAAVLEVAKRTPAQVVNRARRCVHFQIVAVQDFLQVRKVVFLRISFEIFHHVGYWSQRPAMVERFQVVGQNQK